MRYTMYMINVSDDQFAAYIAEAFERLPAAHRDAVRNVAITYADEPTDDQRRRLELRQDQSLFGLYEGVPLTQRHGRTDLPPDRITLFKYPIIAHAQTEADIREQIRHTLWHEVAHYFGLNHSQIRDLE